MFQYTTKVNIDFSTLKSVVDELKASFDEIGHRDDHEGRSRFSSWNNIDKFYSRYADEGSTNRVLEVTGASKGGTARIYFQPSVTSYAKPFRKSIIPVNEGFQFLFTDIKAAEFAMGAMFAQESEAIEAYQNGEDIYMHYAYLFPEGTKRAVIKKILIANMYNQRPYSVAKDLGISEGQAQYLLDNIARAIPKMTMLKAKILAYDRRKNGYYAPNGLDQNDLIKVASVDPVKGFNPDYALSAYIQSALGFFMQSVTNKLLPHCRGTLLSVFDSLLIEHEPKNAKRLESVVSSLLAPFVPDSYGYGKTFWEAAYQKSDIL